jgi:predicted dehydrogenase
MRSASKAEPVRAVLVGAGNRGREIYGNWALRHPDRLKIVAVADPDPARLSLCASEHGIEPALLFSDWRGLFAAGAAAKAGAEACLVCTQDAMHVEPALAALGAGLHVLLEKPMAPDAEDCRRLVAAAEAAGRQLRVCHVVRYTPFFGAIKKAVDSGEIGRPIHIQHAENVSYWHFGHSYVRGNWANAASSTPLVLAKTCHDLDILYWLAGREARRVSAFGSLSWYRPENAPQGAPERCLDGCPHAADCLWYVERLYGTGERLLASGKRADSLLERAAASALIAANKGLRRIGRGARDSSLGEWKGWPATAVTSGLSREGKLAALRGGRYGKCIYRCGNDQPDHEVVSLEFDGGLTASMTVEGLSNLDGRWIRIDGSEGTLEGRFTFAGERLELWRHGSMRRRLLHSRGARMDAHGGGDEGLMESFVSSLRGGEGREPLTSARASLESHLMGFAAETSRLEGRIVDMSELRLPSGGKI